VNIVFDFGRVVFHWKPEEIIAREFSDPNIQDRVAKEVFNHPDWGETDRGTLSFEEMIKRGARRAMVPEAKLAHIIYQVPAALVPIPETIEIIRQLKAAGHHLYALSNMGEVSMKHLEESYDFLELFEDKVISARVKMIKPEPAIFRHMLDQFQLDPQQTVFIDDLCANIEAAAQFGIHTIHFTSPAQCRKALVKLGCL
jgi:putative hydrolase of the HAD superfamily